MVPVSPQESEWVEYDLFPGCVPLLELPLP
jgi:hypothetical protein